MFGRSLTAAMLAATVASVAAAEDARPKAELPRVLRNSPNPFRRAVYKPSEGLYVGRAPAGPYWPQHALELGFQGYSVIDCKVADDLRLNDCRGVYEQPQQSGFADAAQRMADAGWMTAAPLAADAPASPNGWWRFVVPFPRPHR